ncbi:MAG: phosphoribosylformylglycinamidine synthase subunit PurQ [Candidatus Peribacteraceae bacterium]|jgi:phosphoribosylformylglycinamidine synthase
MKKPRIAVVSFPGNNCEYESLRAIAQSDMEPLYFRWNDDRAKLRDADGYFLVGGFSYEDRGRSGMVAARDPLMDFIGREAEEGKVVIGNCNGAQVLVESGMVPLDNGLRMSLARNAVKADGGFTSPGFLSEWVWMTPTCAKDRCATSGWGGAMHLPIAHAEGRFVTADKDVMAELKKNNQLAFSYCDAQGHSSEEVAITPNGSQFGAAGICNPAGNVIALMPHPERTPNGKPYFDSMRMWIEAKRGPLSRVHHASSADAKMELLTQVPGGVEIFIDTVIVNNEERTVEQTAKKFAPHLRLKQWKYFRGHDVKPQDILSDLSVYNPNKERAFVRRGGVLYRWNNAAKGEERLTDDVRSHVLTGSLLLRRDRPDTGAGGLGKNGMSGVCYGLEGVGEHDLTSRKLLEVFCNPHAGELMLLA